MVGTSFHREKSAAWKKNQAAQLATISERPEPNIYLEPSGFPVPSVHLVPVVDVLVDFSRSDAWFN